MLRTNYNSHKLHTFQMPTNSRMDKYIVEYIMEYIYIYSNKNEWIIVMYNDMSESTYLKIFRY